jgi:hypothetical protein
LRVSAEWSGVDRCSDRGILEWLEGVIDAG